MEFSPPLSPDFQVIEEGFLFVFSYICMINNQIVEMI